MVKILPINRLKFIETNQIKSNPIKSSAVSQPISAVTCVGSAVLAGVSTFLKDFNKTVDEDNYFQLKMNPETDKHFEPDVFQKAAAMNLYLGNDVLVTAPTGTGKTAIAEYIITKNLKENKRTFYTTPLKALSNQKFREFLDIYGSDNVGILTGDTKVNIDAPVVVMTTEVYRNMVVSQYFNLENPNKNILENNLGTVVFDELQNLGDVDRGGIWELSIMLTPKDVQMLSLSATIGNNKEINDWMALTRGRKGVYVTPAEGYLPDKTKEKQTVLIDVPSKNRHVPLTFDIMSAPAEIKIPKGRSKKEQIKAKRDGAVKAGTIYAKPSQEIYKDITRKLNKDEKLPALYFIYNKKECRRLLGYLASEAEMLTTKEERTEIEKTIKQYKKQGIYLGKSLKTDALMKGYAVHNAGLLPSQKQLIEELFQRKLLKVVLATDTLSAGINMPAKTVVISSPRKPASTSDGGPDHRRNQTPNEFHQTSGRAGRRGIDTEGLCMVISCNQPQTRIYQQLISQPSNPLVSNIDIDYSFIANYTSEYLDTELLKDLLSKSLYTYNSNHSFSKDKLNELMNRYCVRRDILYKYGYIDNNGRLTTKGELIKDLNGYEQIPIINMVYNKDFARLDAVQLAGIIGGLANIEYSTGINEGVNNGVNSGVNVGANSVDLDFIQIAGKSFYEVKDYEKRSASLYPEREMGVNGNIIEHVYKWAELNSHHGDSRDNWENLYEGDLKCSIKDEGSLFREISTAIDLMKQLSTVAKKGEAISETKEDKAYYSYLAEKLQEGIFLLQREPVIEDAV